MSSKKFLLLVIIIVILLIIGFYWNYRMYRSHKDVITYKEPTQTQVFYCNYNRTYDTISTVQKLTIQRDINYILLESIKNTHIKINDNIKFR